MTLILGNLLTDSYPQISSKMILVREKGTQVLKHITHGRHGIMLK